MSRTTDFLESNDGLTALLVFIVIIGIKTGLYSLIDNNRRTDAELKMKQIQLDSIQKVIDLEKIKDIHKLEIKK